MNIISNIKESYRYFKHLKTATKSINLTDTQAFLKAFEDYFNGKTSVKDFTGWVSACTDIWGKSFAKAKFRIYDRKEDNEEIENHPIVEIFQNPNDFQTFWEIKYRWAQDMVLHGNSYILKVRDSIGVPRMFVQLHADRMNTLPYNVERIEAYEYNTGNGVFNLAKDDIIHFRYPSPVDFIKGRAVKENVSNQLAVDKYQTDYQKKFYKEGGFYGATFSTDQKMSKESFNRMRDELTAKYGGGSENAYKVAVFESGLKPVVGAYSIKDMDIVAQRESNMEEICAAFQVNKFLFGMSEGINRANADTILYMLYYNVIDPLLDYFDEVFTKMLMLDFSEDYYMKHDTLASRDIELDLKYYKEMQNVGVLSPNQIAEMEGLDTYEGGDVRKDINKSATDTSEEVEPVDNNKIFNINNNG